VFLIGIGLVIAAAARKNPSMKWEIMLWLSSLVFFGLGLLLYYFAG